MQKVKPKSRNRRRNGGVMKSNALTAPSGSWVGPPLYVGMGPTNPGRATLRTVVDVTPGNTIYYIAQSNFSAWFGQAFLILTPYMYFRVVDATVECMVNGGAASANSIAFNISNATGGDTSFGGVMNDDYAGLCTAVARPVLHPPKEFWNQSALKWNRISSDTTTYTPLERTAGTISVFAEPNDGTTTVIGHLVATITFEFHTLV